MSSKLKYIRIQKEDGSYGDQIPFYVDSSTVEINGQSLTTKITEIDNSLNTKVVKQAGKGLSTNDYTNAEKQKLSGIEAGATNTTVDSTLSIEGAAADAEVTGNKFIELESLAFTHIGENAPSNNKVKFWVDTDEEPDLVIDETMLVNGAVTEPKLADALKLKTINQYVTPEMFGAVGDGVADDTQAWQEAVDSGLNVMAANGKTYKIGKVTITKDIDIDCGMCKFIQTETEMFYAEGFVEETTGTTVDYTHSNGGYVLSDANKPNYTGYAFLLGTNSLDLSRNYYKCGFPASFKNGYMVETYPIDVENVTVTYYRPITVNIYNILDIEASPAVADLTDCYSIHIKYGVNCCIRNVLASDVHIYMLINIDRCLNTLVEQIFTHSNAENASGNSYHIALMDSCFSNVVNCKLNNDNWHCITTGGTTLVYRTIVRNCSINTKYQFSYLDHPNAIDTIIDNVNATFGLGITQNGEIRNCKIYASTNKAGNGIARVQLSPSNFSWLGFFKVENVELICNEDTKEGSAGINVVNILGTGGIDSERYVNEIAVIGTFAIDPTKTKTIGVYLEIRSISTNYPVHVYKIYMDRTNLQYMGFDSRYNIDLLNCVYTALNMSIKAIDGSTTIPFGITGYTMPNLIYADHLECSYLRGNYANFVFGSIDIYGFDATKSSFSGKFIGDTLIIQNTFSSFQRFENVTILAVSQIVNNNMNIIDLRKSGSTIVFMRIVGANLKWFYADASTSWQAVARAGDLDRSFTQQVTYWTAQEPTQNIHGQLWYDTANQKLKISNGSSWINV